jgi:predicted O-methyltransferase YrrM
MAVAKLLKNASKHLFELGQKFNVLVVPNHYYVPLASTRALRETRSRWNRPVDTRYLPMDLASQVEFLRDNIAPYEPEYRNNTTFKEAVERSAGPGYGYIEAQALHGVLRWLKPRRIIEIGSGVSTLCALHAVRMNEADGAPACEITCVEPYPRDLLRKQPIRLLVEKVEEVDIALFDELEAGDLLFIDSSHAFKAGGDVQRIYLDILPRLKPGVMIHIHDVYIPYALQRDVDKTYMQWMETALLIAMLNHSSRYRIVLCESYLYYEAPDALKAAFPEFSPQSHDGGLRTEAAGPSSQTHFPSSTYLRVV